MSWPLGKKRSAETIQKMRVANLGKKMSLEAIEKTRQFRLGRKLSSATRARISLALRGRCYSEETIERMRTAHVGKKHRPETKAKIKATYTEERRFALSQKNRGINNPHYGKHHSAESKELIAKTHRGKILSAEHRAAVLRALRREDGKMWNDGIKLTPEQRKNMGKGNLGKKASPEMRLKLSLAHRGERHYNWSGGITPVSQVIRRSLQYRMWRSAVLQRDDFTCRICQKRGGPLEVDHYPYSFAQIFHKYHIKSLAHALTNEHFWITDHGRTLCRECHKIAHRHRPLRFMGKFIEETSSPSAV